VTQASATQHSSDNQGLDFSSTVERFFVSEYTSQSEVSGWPGLASIVGRYWDCGR